MDHYFCYSPHLHQYLRGKGFKYICVGLNPDHGRMFWLYLQDEEFSLALNDYSLRKMARGVSKSCNFFSKTGCAQS